MNSLPHWCTHRDSMALSFLGECFPLSPRKATRVVEKQQQQHLAAPFLPADKLPSLSSFTAAACFCWASKMEKKKHGISGCFCSPLHNQPWYEIALIHFPPTDGGEAPFSICSYQPSYTQLPSGILVTLHKIVMISPSRWAFIFFSFFIKGTARPPSQHKLIDAVGAWPHVRQGRRQIHSQVSISTYFF